MTVPRIYQLHLSLQEIEPIIWRRLQVPEDVTLTRLHSIIQAVMGWTDSHLFEFERNGQVYTTPDPDFLEERPDFPASRSRLATLLERPGQTMIYRYDFGDNWVLDVLLEEILEPSPGAAYPVCVGGSRAAPPEDCGGVPGYEELCAAMVDPTHPEREDLLAWCGGVYDPEHFDMDAVNRALRRYQSGTGRSRKGRGESIASLAIRILREAGGPLHIEAIHERMRAEGRDLGPRWKTRLRQALNGSTLVVRTGQSQFDLTARRLAGATFRYRLNRVETKQGQILADGDVAALFRWDKHVAWNEIRPTVYGPGSSRLALAFGTARQPDPAPRYPRSHPLRSYLLLGGLEGLFAEAGAQPGDDLVITVIDPEQKIFRLTIDRQATRDPAQQAAIEAADESVADCCFKILRRSGTSVFAPDLLRRVAGIHDTRSGPGSHFPLFCLATRPGVRIDGSEYALDETTSHPFSPRRTVRQAATPLSFPEYVRAMLAELLPPEVLGPLAGLFEETAAQVLPPEFDQYWQRMQLEVEELVAARERWLTTGRVD